jgi:hypothetical protein
VGQQTKIVCFIFFIHPSTKTGEHYIKWNISDKEIWYVLSHMCIRKRQLEYIIVNARGWELPRVGYVISKHY